MRIICVPQQSSVTKAQDMLPYIEAAIKEGLLSDFEAAQLLVDEYLEGAQIEVSVCRTN